MPLEDQIADVPQADVDVLARRLLGDELVNRYGDVIGARQPTLADGLRDFTIAATKGVDTLEELRLKQKEHFSQSLDRERRAALAAKQQDIDTMKAVQQAIETAHKHPGYGRELLKEALDIAGLPYTKASLKMLADADMAASLTTREFRDAIDAGIIDTGMAANVTGDPVKTAEFLGRLTQREKDQAQTRKILLDVDMKRLRVRDAKARLGADPMAAERRKFLASRLGKMRVTDEATGEQRLATADEINALADQVFGPRQVGADPTRAAGAQAKAKLDQSAATKVQQPQRFGLDFGFPSSTTTTPTTTPPQTATMDAMTTSPDAGIVPTPGRPQVLGIKKVAP